MKITRWWGYLNVAKCQGFTKLVLNIQVVCYLLYLSMSWEHLII